jgi:hypothetical protein
LLGAVLILSPSLRHTIVKQVMDIVVNKDQTKSYHDRTASHLDAMQLLADTYYVGGGLGSMRASGLGFTLLAAVGIPGFLFFLGGYLALFLPLLRRLNMKLQIRVDGMLEQALFAVTLILCGFMISGTEPITPAIWFLFGTAIVFGKEERRHSEPRAYAFGSTTGVRHALTAKETV